MGDGGFNEAIVLDEDGVTGQVSMDDGDFASVQVARNKKWRPLWINAHSARQETVLSTHQCLMYWNIYCPGTLYATDLSAERICMHQRFQAWKKDKETALTVPFS